MSLQVIYLKSFWEDVAAAARWYEDREPGLGSALAVKIGETIDRVIDSPQRFRKIYGQLRSLRTHRFPYAVLYLVEGEVLAFVGLKHGAQEMRRFIAGRLSGP